MTCTLDQSGVGGMNVPKSKTLGEIRAFPIIWK